MLKSALHRAALVALLSIAFVIGCGSSGEDEKPAATGSPVSAAEQQAINEVKEAFTNFGTAKTFKVAIVAQVLQPTGMITNSSFTYEFVPPDRYQFYTGPTANITRQVGAESFSYDRAADKWSLLANYSGPEFQGISSLTNPKRMSDAGYALGKTATVTKGGTETIDGKTCQLYVLTDVPTQNKTDMCIADKLPLRFVYHAGSLNTTVIFSAYNSSIVIDRPVLN